MADKVLLLGYEREAGAALTDTLSELGYHPFAAPWRGFSPRRLGRNRPDAILADADHPDAPPLGELCRAARTRWGDDFPVLAMSAKSKFLEVAELLDAGAAAILPRSAPAALLDRRLSRSLSDSRAGDPEDELPAELADIFAGHGLIRLGDLASVYPGAAPRRPAFRRMAPPDHDWRGVLIGETMDRFYVGKPETYLKWSRFHLFRLPGPEEYAVAEKVLVRRTGPPLAAAVDRSRLPAGADVYAVVPNDGVTAGFIACLLNSRLMDFYFNRVAKAADDGRLRIEDIRDVPLPRPDPGLMQELSRTAALLAHYGLNPESWVDKQSREELGLRMEEAVFGLYGVETPAREELAALHF